jgi:ribosome-associated protein
VSGDDLPVRSGVVVPEAALQWRFGPSGGPGGQHANRAHTRAELRLDLDALASLAAVDEWVLGRWRERFGDEVRVVVDDERSQLRNRELARERLTARLQSALVRSRPRRPTRPSRRARERRLEGKHQRAEVKRLRRRPDRGE